MAESFPAHIRGTAVGGSYNVGRVGSAMAPFLIGVMAESYSIGFGLATLGIAYVVSALIPALFIREKMYDPFGKEGNSATEQKESVYKNQTI
jgi:AAHS family cis,cis-muconate transporter-like MFS transporter